MAVPAADSKAAGTAGQPAVEPEVAATGLAVDVGSGESGLVGLGQPAASSETTEVKPVRPGSLVAVSTAASAQLQAAGSQVELVVQVVA